MEVPALPCCYSPGRISGGILRNLSEVILLYLEALRDEGQDAPGDVHVVYHVRHHRWGLPLNELSFTHDCIRRSPAPLVILGYGSPLGPPRACVFFPSCGCLQASATYASLHADVPPPCSPCRPTAPVSRFGRLLRGAAGTICFGLPLFWARD